MIIELKQEDADFILKFIKSDLIRVRKNLTTIEQSDINFTDDFSASTEKAKEFIVINNIMKNVKNVVCENSKNLCNDLEKCVELLTIGSEK